MNKQYLLSVIVPVYNVENYLRKCVDSIIKQKYQNLQIILIDDGSTDSSGEICDKYALANSKIEVVHQTNGGVVNARKAGLVLAKGEYIGFVDADEYVEPDFYSDMIEIMIEKNVDFVHSGFVIEKKVSSEVCIPCESGLCDISHSQTEFINKYIFETNNELYMPHNLWSKLFKAELVKECFMQIPDCQVRGEDMICTCLCVLKSNRIYLTDTMGYHYVRRYESITNKVTVENVIDYGTLYRSLLDIFNKYGKLEIVRVGLEHYFKDFFINFFVFQLNVDNILLYKYSDTNSLKGKKVALYCAGKVGQDYYAQLSKYKDINIVVWVDKHFENYRFDYREVIRMEKLCDYEFDILLIAVLNKNTADEIKYELIGSGIQENKIVWKHPVCISAEEQGE